MTELVGKVAEVLIARGSKSERKAVVLQSDDGQQFVLRRSGGHPFVDRDLDQLVGKTIRANGRVADSLFIMSDWDVV